MSRKFYAPVIIKGTGEKMIRGQRFEIITFWRYCACLDRPLRLVEVVIIINRKQDINYHRSEMLTGFREHHKEQTWFMPAHTYCCAPLGILYSKIRLRLPAVKILNDHILMQEIAFFQMTLTSSASWNLSRYSVNFNNLHAYSVDHLRYMRRLNS